MTLSYQKINLVVFIVLSIAKCEAYGRASRAGPPTTAAAVAEPAWPAGTSSFTEAAADAAAACSVKYTPTDSQPYPLLFGGVEESCRSGCQPRAGSTWNKACRRDPSNPAWGLCLPQQRQQLVSYLQTQVQQGAADASILSLHPCQLHELLASGGRTLWLIGDSHIKQIYAAMRCFMTDFWQHTGGECAASSNTDLQFQLDDVTASGHHYRTAPRCLHLLGGSGARICLVHSPKGDMFFGDNPQGIGTLQLLAQSFVGPQDILYISVGRWHANNCEGVGPKFAAILTQIGQFARDHAATIPNIFFSASPFDHVMCGPDKTLLLPSAGVCVPPSEGHYSMDVWKQVVQLSHDILGSTYGVPLVDTYKWTILLHWAHIQLANKEWDCLHYCRPGLPEIEIWSMFKAFQSRGLQGGAANRHDTAEAAAEAAAAGTARVCMPLQKRADRVIDWPVGRPDDRDDLGYLMPHTPEFV